ncbi:hypothetical protein DW960_10310 [Ruminococcus bromii]|nr:hypothetical protein DW960_10310 [Ruminococcus bromii]
MFILKILSNNKLSSMMAILYISDFYQSLRFTGLTNEKTVNFANAQIVKKQGTLQILQCALIIIS